MAATPTATTSAENDFGKIGRLLRKSGTAFGLDLAGLFEDEEGNAVEGFNGFAPSFRIESQLKGRSPSTMTYKAPKTPSRTAVFELAPSAVIQAPGGTSEKPAPPVEEIEQGIQQKADRLLSSFIGEDGKEGAIGAMGIGRAQGYGYTNEEILAKARAENLKFGEQAARGLGLNTDTSSYIKQGGTQGALGSAAVERMRGQGLSDQAIRSLAQQQGMKFGVNAANMLGVGAEQTYRPPAPAAAPAPIVSYASSSAQQSNPGAIGLAGIERAAAAQGISAQEAARRAVAQGTQLGAAAAALLR